MILPGLEGAAFSEADAILERCGADFDREALKSWEFFRDRAAAAGMTEADIDAAIKANQPAMEAAREVALAKMRAVLEERGIS